jgi:hypothetical protein
VVIVWGGGGSELDWRRTDPCVRGGAAEDFADGGGWGLRRS